MPPKHIEDIDFPDLSDKILEVLYTLWEFICDVFLVLWFYIASAFWAVWTWPPIESFRFEFSAALVALWDYVGDHPVTSTAICILAFIAISSMLNIIRVCLLHGAGAGQRVLLRGTRGPYYQSTGYGGNVHRNSAFSRPQSRGTKSGGQYRVIGAGSSSWA